jgi:uncharacterized protein involved in exopolysaccharide biosynthesis
MDDETGLVAEHRSNELSYSFWAGALWVLRLLWRNRRTTSRFVFYGFLLSVLLALALPKRYVSTTRLMPPDKSSGGGLSVLASLGASGASGNAGALGGFASSLLSMQSTSSLLIGILSSETAQNDLIDRFHLLSRYGVTRYEDARKILTEKTKLEEDRKTGIVTISVGDKDPFTAAAMADAYVRVLNRLVTQLSTSEARRERIFLQARLQAVKSDLDLASKRLSEFSSQNAVVDVKDQGRTMMEAAARLEGELIAAQAELEGLSQIYALGNVRVRATQARIRELQRQLDELAGQKSDPAAAVATTGDGRFPSIRKLPILGVTYADLVREAKIEETVYAALTQQFELAKVQEAKQIPTIRVLDIAAVPEKSVFPPGILVVGGGCLFAFAVALGRLLAQEYWMSVPDGAPIKIFAAEITTHARTHWRRRQLRFSKPMLRRLFRSRSSDAGESDGH